MDLTNNQLAFSFSIERILSMPNWPPVPPSAQSNSISPYSPLSISLPSPPPVLNIPHPYETFFSHAVSAARRSHHLENAQSAPASMCPYNKPEESWRMIPSFNQQTSNLTARCFQADPNQPITQEPIDSSLSPLYQLLDINPPVSSSSDSSRVFHQQQSATSLPIHKNTADQSENIINSSHSVSRSRKTAHRSKGETRRLETARMENVSDLLNHDDKSSRSLNTKCRRFFRAVFTEKQRISLEKAFAASQYIQKGPRTQLAESLGLTELQVKVWFQNRRMKWRSSKEYQSMTQKLSPETYNG